MLIRAGGEENPPPQVTNVRDKKDKEDGAIGTSCLSRRKRIPSPFLCRGSDQSGILANNDFNGNDWRYFHLFSLPQINQMANWRASRAKKCRPPRPGQSHPSISTQSPR